MDAALLHYYSEFYLASMTCLKLEVGYPACSELCQHPSCWPSFSPAPSNRGLQHPRMKRLLQAQSRQTDTEGTRALATALPTLKILGRDSHAQFLRLYLVYSICITLDFRARIYSHFCRYRPAVCCWPPGFALSLPHSHIPRGLQLAKSRENSHTQPQVQVPLRRICPLHTRVPLPQTDPRPPAARARAPLPICPAQLRHSTRPPRPALFRSDPPADLAPPQPRQARARKTVPAGISYEERDQSADRRGVRG